MFPYLVLQVFVPLKLALDILYVPLELYLTVILLFELLTELIEFDPQVPPLFLEILYLSLKLKNLLLFLLINHLLLPRVLLIY